MKKISGLALLSMTVIVLVFVDAGGQSGGMFDRAESGCTCHESNPDPSVTVSITGLPIEYTPSQTYPLTVSVSGGPATPRGGFNLLVSAGTLSTTDIDVLINGPQDQATHENEFVRSWDVDWTAPSSGTGDVTFQVAGLAAGDPSNANGDLWNFHTSIVPEIAANNPPESQSLSVQGFGDGTVGIAHITDHTPDLGWTFMDPDGGDSQQQYHIRVGTSSGLSDMWNPGQQAGSTGSAVYAGSALQDGTDYWFGARINDGTEWSLWNETQFHMNSLPESETLSVQGFPSASAGIMHVTDHTPLLNWSSSDAEVDSQQQYQIRVGTASGQSNMWNPGAQAGASETELYAGSVLQDGTDYWFGIRVYDGYEWSVWNETMFHMNSIEARELAVQGFSDGSNGILHVTDHTPDLGWLAFDSESDGQLQYEIKVGTGSGLSDMWNPGAQAGGVTSVIYGGLPLLDFTDYWFGIRVFDGYEWSVWNETMFHMNNLSETQEPTVDGFAGGSSEIMHITNSNPLLGWTFFDLEGGDVQQQYEVRVGTTSGSSDMWSPGSLIGPTNAVTYTGLPLADGADYWFSVRVYDGYEWSAWNETMFHMNKLPESQDLSVQGYFPGSQGILHVTDHTPVLGWSFYDSEIGDSQQQYEIRIGTGPGLSDMWAPGPSAGGTNSEIYGGAPLLDGVDYWFGLLVYDGYEWSLLNETQFHMNSLPPAPVPPLSPSDDGNVPSSPAQILSWTAGGVDSEGDTITYSWFVDTDNPPISPYLANGTTTGTSSSSFATSPSTDYYWYVNATDSWEWIETIVWNFTTSAVVNNPPEAINPTVSGFSGGTSEIGHITDHSPDLAWNFFDTDGGDSQVQYEIRVGTSSGLSDMWAPGSQAGGINSTVYTGLTLQDGMSYWFAVRVYDGNTWSAWNETEFHLNSAEAQGLTVQGYPEGSQGLMHITDHTPDLAWSFWDAEGDGQQEYELRVGTAPGLSDMWAPGPQPGAASSVIYAGSLLIDGADYWFGILVYDGYEWSLINDTQFHMNSPPPAPVPPLSPPNDSSVPSSPAQTLSWTAGGVDSEGDIITYSWFVDTDNPPMPPYLANGTTTGSSSSSFVTSSSTDYYWLVNATDSWEWNVTIVWNFTTSAVVNNPPEAVDMTVSGFLEGTNEIAHILDHTPDLAWSFFDNDGGDSQMQYEIRVGTSSGLSDMWSPGPQTGAANMQTYSGSPLIDGVNYWFGISVFDGNTWSVFNETQFQMNSLPPAPVPPLNPPDDSNVPDSPAQTLSWTAGGADPEGDTVTYNWYLDTEDPPNFPYLANGSTTGTSSASFSTAPGTDYYWIINITDGWEWISSAVWNFTTSGTVNIPPEAQALLISGFAQGTDESLHISDHTPDLSWIFYDDDAGDIQQQYDIKIGSAPGLSDMWAPGPQIGSLTSVTYAGSALVDGEDYWFAVRVFDGIDWSLLNETMFHMNTKSESQDLAVDGYSEGTLEIMHLLDHTPDLSWSFKDSEVSDSQAEYEIRVGTSIGLDDMWALGPQSGSETDVMYNGITLQDGTDYWFGIRIYDGYEWSLWNETMFHMNTPPAVSVPPLDPSHNSTITSNSNQTVSWTPGGSDPEGDTIQYLWFVDSELPLSEPFLANGSTEGTLSGTFATAEGLQYYWFVNATDGWEWSTSQIWTFATAFPPNIPPQVEGLTVQGFSDGTQDIMHITDHTPELAWTFLDSNTGDNQLGYHVRVGSSSGSSDMFNSDPVEGAEIQIIYSGLELVDGENYWFGIRVSDGKDWSEWTEVEFHMNLPAQIVELSVDGYSEGTLESLNISGSQPVFDADYVDPDGGKVETKYEVRIGSTEGGSDIWVPGPQTGVFQNVTYQGPDLSQGTEYWLSLRIYDGYEWGDTSELKFRTNTVPLLFWTGDPGYESDGLEPDEGDPASTFIFLVKYTDSEGHPPQVSNPMLHILSSGEEITASPFPMNYKSGDNLTGAVYSISLDLPEGTDYTYYFTAMDIRGGEAAVTIEKNGPIVTVITPESLFAPENVTAASTPRRGEVLISWDAVEGTNIAGYRIYRSTVPIATGNASGYELVDIVNSETTSYNDMDLEDGTTYYYVIKAFDSTGNESGSSVEVFATTIKGSDESTGSNPSLWILLVVVFVVVFILILLMLTRGKKMGDELPPSHEGTAASDHEDEKTYKTDEDPGPQDPEDPRVTMEGKENIGSGEKVMETEGETDIHEDDLPPPED